MTISGTTRLYAVIGDPIAHSLSPCIHNFWIKQAGIDAAYLALPVAVADAKTTISSLFKAGISGLNVTSPFKDDALNAAVEVSGIAEQIGASNTLLRGDNGWIAQNTDSEGFLCALTHALGDEALCGKHIALIGAGGASRAVVHALRGADVQLTIVNRTIARADELAASLMPTAQTAGLHDLVKVIDQADIVVNASSMGLHGEGLSLPSGKGRLFYDLTYGKAALEILDKAIGQGWKTEDGLRMLVEHARVAFRHWHGIDPDADAAFRICQQELKTR